jgi:hypothetical protein
MFKQSMDAEKAKNPLWNQQSAVYQYALLITKQQPYSHLRCPGDLWV